MLTGRSKEKKEKLIKNLTAAVVDSLEAPVESVRVILQEMPPEHYGIAGLPFQTYKASKGKN
jgi:4-oxalocrotonate tautomerase